ncbi:Asp-tRNA(Asn)/Glu-tRNA(Gln) amidotransferase subunit GatB, partial [Candidatus Saccharibacteria bacterium]|nr:Asp-tRNA(Asn)/Glu-tRNA(Gln) amidotransferase subunit GatB [Candidatus Saccharibacteria bacterium]
EPDVPPIVLTDEYIEEVESSMPLLPSEYRSELTRIGLDRAVIEDIIAVPSTAQAVMEVLKSSNAEHAKRAAFWLMQPQSDDNTDADTAIEISPAQLVKLSEMVSDSKLSSTAAKDVLAEMMKTGDDPESIAEKKNLIQVSDEGALDAIVAEVLAENEKAANDVKAGEMKAIGFLVGQVMAKSKGKANPALAQQLIKKHLGV